MHRRIVALALLAACAGEPGGESRQLPNSAGKDDSATIRLKLTDGSPSVSFSIGCDQQHGCEGHVGVKLKSPEACTLFDNPLCGSNQAGPLTRDVLTATIVTTTEGERRLPLRVETGDGERFTTELAAAFTARGEEELDVTLEKLAGTPDLTIEVRAEWKASMDPGGSVAELRAFLETVPGLTFEETGTAQAGYRAFTLEYVQPLDHDNPALGTFEQRIMLHHRVREAPMVLYTSGYDLSWADYLSELGTAMQANQLSTEQRFFGTSVPPGMTPDQWRHVTIAQAAKDHHRIVQALRPFYRGAWLSTGHSKGGMTSLFHRRFFPDDVDATVAYVAPISFADPDPRYIPFLDQIGEAACRDAIRGVQKLALEKFDELFTRAQQNDTGQTYVRAGGHASAFEKSIVLLEWLFWQHNTVDECGSFLGTGLDATADALYTLVSSYAGSGWADAWVDRTQAYYYQAATQLGKQAFATAHLQGLLRHEETKIDFAPPGTTPAHDPAAMTDVQNWIKSGASEVLFLYGQYDPWTGGAYELGDRPEVVKLVAPKQPHGAMLADLTETDRAAALQKIEQWIGVRPNITPEPTPHPAVPFVQ